MAPLVKPETVAVLLRVRTRVPRRSPTPTAGLCACASACVRMSRLGVALDQEPCWRPWPPRARLSFPPCSLYSQAGARTRALRRRQVLILGLISLVAISSRLFSVVRYESVIHEFDPWFNYRTTRELVQRGVYDFLNWCVVRVRARVCVCGGRTHKERTICCLHVCACVRVRWRVGWPPSGRA
jgi:hypothetical protein